MGKTEMKIDVEACHKGNERELKHAAQLLQHNFQGNRETFRQYFGLKVDAPALVNIESFTSARGGAWQEGFTAGKNGLTYSDNPYSEPQATAWAFGCSEGMAARNRDALRSQMTAASCAESFWEFLRGNIQYPECAEQMRRFGATVTETEIRAARMENRACVITIDSHTYEVPQP